MQIGILRIELFIANAASLKDKRMVIKSLMQRIKNKFNVSVCEVDAHEKWQRSVFGIAAVGNGNAHVNSVLDNVLDFIRNDYAVSITDFEMQIL
jgi:uncharacterized protein YlxP (DUF503 family)